MAFEIRSTSEFDSGLNAIGVGFYSDYEMAGSWPGDVDIDALKTVGFEGKQGQVHVVPGVIPQIVVGLGDRTDSTPDIFRRAAAQFIKAASRFEKVGLVLDGHQQAVAEGLILGAYKFTKYKSKNDGAKIAEVQVLRFDTNVLNVGVAIGKAVCLARDLINEPARDMTPTRFVDVAADVAADAGFRTEVWVESRIKQEHLGGLLGVAAGSDQPPRLLQMFYEPDGAERTLIFVGKGITFDSGGLSIKPADGMMTMKTDMSGAATVLAAMSVVPLLAPNARVIGIAALTENVIGPNATKPGDVLTARNGKTMEVLNTDAEGRLVLADALSLAVEYEPDAIVDLATLTGACKVALGSEIGGLFTNDDEFSGRVKAAAQCVDELLWELPLHKGYRKLIDSEIADVKNIGPGGPGATTAALFLQEFVGDKPWVHLDIAGPARSDSEDAYIAKGGTGFGVRTLIQLIRDF